MQREQVSLKIVSGGYRPSSRNARARLVSALDQLAEIANSEQQPRKFLAQFVGLVQEHGRRRGAA